MGLRLPCIFLFLAITLAVGCSGVARPSSSNRPSATEATTNVPVDVVTAAHAHYAAAIVQELSGNPDLALEEFKQAALLDPGNETLALEVSQRLVARKKLEEALEVLLKASKQPEASGAIFNHIGYLCVRLDRMEEAMAANKQAIKRSPTVLAGYQNLYLNYMQKGQRAEAYKVLEQAAKASAADADFLVNLAELFANFGRQTPSQKSTAYAAAVKLLNQALTKAPLPPELELKAADGFNLLNKDAKAKEIYLKLLSQPDKLPQAISAIRVRLADIYLREGDRQRAVEQLQAVLVDDPANLAVNLQLGSLAQDEKRFQLAADCFRKVVLLRPEIEPPYYELAQAQLSLDEPHEALETLAQARAQFAESYVGELLAGIACGRLNDLTNAIAHFAAAEVFGNASTPSRLNGMFYYQFGALCESSGDTVQAEKLMLKSLELSPNYAEAQNFLGYLWAEHGTNLPVARQLIEKAVQTDPDNPAYLDSLAWVLFKQGLANEALPHMLKAVELTEKPEAVMYDHLGDIHFALKQDKKAREAWQKSLSLESNEAVRKKLISMPAASH